MIDKASSGRFSFITGVVLAFLVSLAAHAGAADFQEGEDYVTLPQPQPTVDSGKIEVVEMFWYGCPHCYTLHPAVSAWSKQLPDDVAFVYMPASTQSEGPVQLQARAFYTAQALDQVETLHNAMFVALHENKQRLNTLDQIRELFVANGVDAQRFDKIIASPGIRAKANAAYQRAIGYQIEGVPVIIVNGKYRIDASAPERMLQVAEFLIGKERAMQTREPLPPIMN